MSLKNKMLIFGLCSTSDDQLRDLSDECWPKCKKKKKGPWGHEKIKCSFLDYVQLLMISQVIWVTNVNQNAKKKMKKGPLCHWKIRCSFLDYVQLLMIGRVIWASNVNWKAKEMKEGPLCHWKIKCSVLDYIQLLMISQVIQATKIKWNAKRSPKSSKNEMLGFRLCSTFDDQLSDLSGKHWPKCKIKRKKAPHVIKK